MTAAVVVAVWVAASPVAALPVAWWLRHNRRAHEAMGRLLPWTEAER